MHRFLSSALILVAGCAPALHVQPAPGDPHATVKVRMVYHSPPETLLAERVMIDDGRLDEGSFGGGSGTNVRAVRVAPGVHRWRVRSVFSHNETRMVQEQYTERYQCGTQRMGNRDQPRYCNRTKYRTVQKTERILDARCDIDQTHVVDHGTVYVAQYDFYEHDHCQLSWFRQVTNADGSFQLVPAI
ncbi:MAG: hypothetical protein CMN30_08030 [Sandaracinus sp.]|nr:hypothetical protein [Sandaracinus sp.]